MSIYCVRDAIKNAKKAVAFTGAGVSVESGIPDFRGDDGIWKKYPIAEYATIDAFQQAPERFWRFYFELSHLFGNAQPNPAHHALAELEKMQLLQAVITQNIDGFHQAAGNIKVIELHGQANALLCLNCNQRRPENILALSTPPHCSTCDAVMKPDVVLFGENLPVQAFEDAWQFARQCDLCLVVGTSALVYPAAGIPDMAFKHGATLCQFDIESTQLTHSGRVRHFVEGPAGKTLSRLVELIQADLT